MKRSLILGRDPNDLPRPVSVDVNGNINTVPGAGTQAVRMVDVAGDSCMDEANNAVQVNVVAGGAGGGAATIADGADVAQGSLADAEVAGVGPASVIAILKRIRTLLAAPLAVAGTFWQLVQPVSVVDGADIAQGATADAAVITDAAGTMSAKLRGLVKWAFERMPASLGQKAMAASLPVVVASDQTAVPVSGTFWQATQPVSGAFFQATQPVSVADGGDVAQGAQADAAVVTDVAGTISGKLRGLVKWAFERMPASLGQKTKAASLPVTLASDEDAVAVTGTFWQATQPVSGTVTAAQGTHDNLNTNANMQVGDADADVDNPVPVLAGGPFTAVLGIEALAASTMYQLIDLSDAVNFPHTGTTAIILKRLRLHAEKATDGIFDVWVGILYENDGTDGSARWLHCFHLEAVGNPTDSTDRFAQELEYNLDLEVSGGALVNYVSNEQLANDALLKNDVARTSPVGTANPAVGDLMVYVEEVTDGGTLDFVISADYNTR